jgi:hypothetical protein
MFWNWPRIDGIYFWAAHCFVDEEPVPAAAVVCCARVEPVKAMRRVIAKVE